MHLVLRKLKIRYQKNNPLEITLNIIINWIIKMNLKDNFKE